MCLMYIRLNAHKGEVCIVWWFSPHKLDVVFSSVSGVLIFMSGRLHRVANMLYSRSPLCVILGLLGDSYDRFVVGEIT